MGRGLLLRFAVGAMVGVVAAVAVGAVLAGPRFGPSAPPGDPVSLVDGNGGQVDFTIVEGTDPKPLEPLPVDATIQLTSFHGAGPSADPGGGGLQPWWNDSVPRIPPVSQFDGGPLASVNCLMASAAMLARLGYGVVTTGSQLRALSGDTEGGTAYSNVQDAMRRGWGVRFFEGALTPLQLRAVLWAGAGAIVHGVYGNLPERIRTQPSFTGRHAMYVDAFSPTALDGGPAYYVMDPIGKTWAGYKGEWWPAADLERMMVELPGGRLGAMWAFPGGVAPTDRPVLPPEAYPSGVPGPPTPGPSGSAAPADPFPVDPLPLPPDEPPDGEETGADPPVVTVEITDGYAEVWPGYDECLVERRPEWCPRGIIGVIDLDGFLPTATQPPRLIDILYGSSIGPGIYQIIFEPPPDTRPELWFWTGVTGSELEAATVEEGTLGGRTVAIGTIFLDPALDYQFVATAEGDGVRTISEVGALEVVQ